MKRKFEQNGIVFEWEELPDQEFAVANSQAGYLTCPVCGTGTFGTVTLFQATEGNSAVCINGHTIRLPESLDQIADADLPVVVDESTITPSAAAPAIQPP